MPEVNVYGQVPQNIIFLICISLKYDLDLKENNNTIIMVGHHIQRSKVSRDNSV